MTLYEGRCQCGEVTFRVEAHIGELTTCDCSLCARRNALMAIVPETALTVLSGEDRLTRYTWNTGLAKHYFCSACGIYVFHRKRAMPKHFSVNVFCLDRFDRRAVPVRATDGIGMSVVASSARPHWPGPRDDS